MFKFFSVLCVLVFGLQAKESAGRAELLVSHDSVELSSSFLVGIKLVAPKGWHTYWKNPGDSGMATSVRWLNKKGFSASDLMFPAPQVFESYGMKSYGHENEVLLLMRVELDKDFTEPQLDFSFELDWLACKKLCLPGSARLSGQVKIGKVIKSESFQWLIQHEKALPKSEKANASFHEGHLSISFDSNQQISDKALFICEDEESTVSGVVKINQLEPRTYNFKIKGNPEFKKGILIWQSPQGERLSLALAWQK